MAPPEYQRSIEERDDATGTTDEIDAAGTQAEEAAPAGGEYGLRDGGEFHRFARIIRSRALVSVLGPGTLLR
jgi:hypothetical protein